MKIACKALVVIAALFGSGVAIAQQVPTPAGIAQVARHQSGAKVLFIGDKLVPGIGDTAVEILKNFKVDSNVVLLIGSECGGTACSSVSYRFVTIRADKRVIVSQQAFGDEGEPANLVVDPPKVMLTLTTHVGRKKRTKTYFYNAGSLKMK